MGIDQYSLVNPPLPQQAKLPFPFPQVGGSALWRNIHFIYRMFLSLAPLTPDLGASEMVLPEHRESQNSATFRKLGGGSSHSYLL